MSNQLQYTLSLNDAMSAKLKAIGISSDGALSKFAKLEQQTNENKKLLDSMGTSVGSLKSKLDLLKAEREWIPSSNIQSLQRYNREIQGLERQITSLESLSGRSKLGQNLRSAFDQIPFASTLINPIVATGAALFKSGQMAYSFDTGMAKINTTAQLTQSGLAELKKDLLSVDPKYVDNWSAIPEAYEKIISQTSDVGKSSEILKASLIASKAGFAEVNVVSDATARSLSLIKEQGVSATKVLDTFFAAKRVGAGEFEDFARYIPGLIASGDALGIKYKEVAGMFAYMTGKGQSAERSAVLMENAFSAMGKSEIRDNLGKNGINIFDDQGSMRSMQAIFNDFNAKMAGMSDEGKSSFLERMGLVDKEARSAFIVMSNDMDKLNESMQAVNNSQGEMQRAFENSRTPADRLAEMWSKIQQIGLSLGGALATVLNPALHAASWVIGITADGLTWLFDGIASGNPYVIALVASVSAFHIAMNLGNIAMRAQNAWLNILIAKEQVYAYFKRAGAIATGIATAATWAWEMATIALNAAWAMSPIGLVTVAAVALGAAVYGVTKLMEQGTAAEKLAGEVKDRALTKSIQQRTELELLFSRLKMAKAGTDEYKKALQDLEAAYPGISKQFDLLTGKIEQQNQAYKFLLGNILQAAEAEAKKELISEKTKELIEFRDKKKDPTKNFSKWELATIQTEYLQTGKYRDEILQDEIRALALSSVMDQQKSDAVSSAGAKKLDEVFKSNNGFTETQINEQLGNLRTKKEGLVIGSAEYIQANQEIDRLQNILNPKTGGGGTGSLNKGLGRSNEAITSGGSRAQIVNINFKNVVETVSIVGKDLKESVKKMEEDVADGLLRALNMALTTAG